MPEIVNFDIVYKRPYFLAGQMLEGYVIIELQKPIRARSIRLEIVGRASTCWSHTRHNGDKQITEVIRYSAEENYINQWFLLWKCQNDDHLNEGTYRYPFCLQIPPNCPSNFSCKHGSIVNYCRAIIVRSSFWKNNKNIIKPFGVMTLYDLNMNPKVRMGVGGERSKKFGNCCWSAGDMSISVYVPRCGFVPGEEIPVKIQIMNDSSKHVKTLVAELSQEVLLRARKHKYGDIEEKRLSTCVGQYKNDDVEIIGPFTNEQFEWNIELPGLPPSLFTSSIIEIYYCLSFKLVTKGMLSDSLKLPYCPVIIGSIPILDRNQQTRIPIPIQDPIPFRAEMFQDEEAPPPSYDECIKK